MIIFYNKKTGDIIGTIDGRVHDEHTLKHGFISVSNIPTEDIIKYVVPFKPNEVEVEENIEELRVVDKNTGMVEKVITGTRKVKQVHGLIPDVPFKDLVYDLENRKKHITDYKVDISSKVFNLIKK